MNELNMTKDYCFCIMKEEVIEGVNYSVEYRLTNKESAYAVYTTIINENKQSFMTDKLFEQYEDARDYILYNVSLD